MEERGVSIFIHDATGQHEAPTGTHNQAEFPTYPKIVCYRSQKRSERAPSGSKPKKKGGGKLVCQ